MLEVKLEDILIHKTFGKIQLGMHKENVLKILGIPDFKSNPDALVNGFEIYSYDWFEFTFLHNKLHMFYNKHILIDDTKFNEEFHYQNEYFKVTTWFKNYKEDLKLENFLSWLKGKKIDFIQKPYFDSIKIIIDHQVEVSFYSQHAYHMEYEEWSQLSNEVLNWQFGAFFVLTKTST